jgi:hypothetical protein
METVSMQEHMSNKIQKKFKRIIGEIPGVNIPGVKGKVIKIFIDKNIENKEGYKRYCKDRERITGFQYR